MKRWNLDEVTDEYKMESNMFDYDDLKKSEFFGIKKYADAVFRGEVN